MAPDLLVRLAVCAGLAAAARTEPCAEGAVGECGVLDEASSMVHVGLLQHAHSMESMGQRGGVSERRLARTFPLPEQVAWFHVPKAGSSFEFTLLGLPQLCSNDAGSLETWATVIEVESLCPGIWTPSWCFEKHSQLRVGDNDMRWSLCAESGFFGKVASLGRSVMGFFRQPEQRLLSDYYFSCTDGSWTDDNCGKKDTYFQTHQACATKMLTSTDSVEGHCQNIPEPTEADVALAETYLLQSFAFIGITEQWDLSVCLFNAKFGTPCSEKQFLNSRLWHTNASDVATLYDVVFLDGFVDKHDNVLYDRALEIFAHELVQFGVTTQSCLREIAHC